MEEKLERAIVVELKIEADDIGSLVNALHDLATQIAVEQYVPLSSVCGGYSWSHILTSRTHEITHDEYFEQIEKVLSKSD